MGVTIRTGNKLFDEFYPRIRAFLANDTSDYFIAGRIIHGYRSPDTNVLWLRDHTHQMKGFKYFESDMTSCVEEFLRTQRSDGSFHDAVRKMRGKDSFERWRADVEADVEYLAVKASYTIWQATGNDEWMQKALPCLERGMGYAMHDPWRWSKEYNLVKRPFTIDTWDFEYGNWPIYNPYRKDLVKWCIMHGDNSGMYEACMLLAKMYGYLCDTARAEYWLQQAELFRENTNKVCWNGRFYTHQVHMTPVEIPGIDESQQLSLSNAYDINRGICSHEQAASIIREYLQRRKTTSSFAEWFSIDPPFPEGTFPKTVANKPGGYVNGGIMPLVGGELSRACFEHGFEAYGLDILLRYEQMIRETGETYLWYYPDGTPPTGGDILPTDGWGAAAMLYAFVEGLVGVEDLSKCYQAVRCSPRWVTTKEKEVFVSVGYGACDSSFSYHFSMDTYGDLERLNLQCSGDAKRIYFHVLLPESRRAREVYVDGSPIGFAHNMIGDSLYVDFEVQTSTPKVEVLLMPGVYLGLSNSTKNGE